MRETNDKVRQWRLGAALAAAGGLVALVCVLAGGANPDPATPLPRQSPTPVPEIHPSLVVPTVPPLQVPPTEPKMSQPQRPR
jgi:hypothetical protein